MRRRTRRRIILGLIAFLFATEIILRIQRSSFGSIAASAPLLDVEVHRVTEDLQGAYWIEHDFHGEYFNIERGARRTVGQPTNPAFTVWLFGNSTLFGMYNADADTAASQLQALFNAAGYRAAVINLATRGQNTASELARLRVTPIGGGDMVVFVDGLVDAQIMMVCDPTVYPLMMMQVACENLDNSPFVLDPRVARDYWKHIGTAEAWTRQRGAAFYHFLQPQRDETYRYKLIIGSGTPLRFPRSAFVDDDHLTTEGNHLLAAALYDAIATF